VPHYRTVLPIATLPFGHVHRTPGALPCETARVIMLHRFNAFLRDDCGATTVDWVLLTAGLVSLTLAVMSTFGSGAEDVSTAVSSTVAARPTTITW